MMSLRRYTWNQHDPEPHLLLLADSFFVFGFHIYTYLPRSSTDFSAGYHVGASSAVWKGADVKQISRHRQETRLEKIRSREHIGLRPLKDLQAPINHVNTS